MKKNSLFQVISITVFTVLLAVMLGSCTSPTTPPAEETAPIETEVQQTEGAGEEEEVEASPEEEEEHPEGETEGEMVEGDVVRGGLLYDQWWSVDLEEEHEDEHEHEGSEAAPDTEHPLWATQSTNERTGSDTWRCKECHGWDYKGMDGAYGEGSHYTGFVGVIQLSGSDPGEIIAALKGSTNPDHDFSSVLDDKDLADLGVFVSEALIDTDELVNDDKSSTGEAAAGETLYGEVCTNCHGPAGNAINFSSLDDPEFLGHLAPDNPWEFIHKVRFGQPGWPMPSGIGNNWTDEDVANVLAYAQTLSAEPAVSGGGQLYDQWWAVLDLDEPQTDQPLWATQSTNERTGADTWRCKECHGWDYKGADGAYGSGSHFTDFTGILDSASMSSEELQGWLNGSTNPDHDFSQMEEFAFDALINFLQGEMADISPYVNADSTVNGDPANGRDLFEGTCASCHGLDGKEMNFGDAEEPEYLGTIANDNPWEFFHKASFGQPGEPMPSAIGLGWSMQDIADLLAFAQTLPPE